MDESIDVRLIKAAEARHGVFGEALLREIGFSKRQRSRRLRDGRWTELHEGVYRFAGSPISPRGELLAACIAGGPRCIASHRSAAGLRDLPGRDPRLREVLCPRWNRAVRPGLVVHESKLITPEDVTTVDSIPVTSVPRTLLDLGAVCSPATVERAVEAALRRQLVSLGELEAVLRRLGTRGRNGVGVLRAILEERTVDRRLTESDMELLLLQVLRKNGMPEPVVQYEIWHRGVFIARVDAAYVDSKIALEYESYEHHTGKRALVRDSARRNAIVAIGWRPISVTWEDLRSGGLRVCTDILGAMRVAS